MKIFTFLLGLCSLVVHSQGLLPEVPVPKENPMSAEKIELGKMLYFEPRLSVDGTISCNSCHNVMANGADGRAVGVGVKGQRGDRKSPTVWNSAYNTVQFWDGRAESLEEQAKGPLTNPVEMAMPSEQAVIDRIQQLDEYVDRFKKVFSLKKKKQITIDHVAKAIAAYERTLVTGDSPYDRFVKGDQKALSASAQRGLKLVGEVGCTSCHSGPHFAGQGFEQGQGHFQMFPLIDSEYTEKYQLKKDLGRFNETKKDEDKHMWRVPTWRNIAVTAPYFHNGSVKTLDEAVRVMAKTQLGQDLEKKQVEDIVAFLNSLTGEFPAQQMPRLPLSSGFTLTPDP